MATYIEKHTAVTKDVLNVDHNNRETFQHVKFMNPDNIYMGMFTGSKYVFQDDVTSSLVYAVLSDGNAVLSGEDGITSIVDSDQIKDKLSESAVQFPGAVPSMKLLSSLIDDQNEARDALAGKVVYLSGDNIVHGSNKIDQLSAAQLSAAQLSVPTFNDIAADGETLSSKLSSMDSSVSALADELRAADAALDSKIDDVYDSLQNVSADLDEDLQDLADDLHSNYTLTKDLSAYGIDLSSSEVSGGIMSYVLYQGGIAVGSIDVPVDILVDKGEVKAFSSREEQAAAGVPEAQQVDGPATFIKVTLNDIARSVLWINVTSLIDVYTGKETNTVTVNIKDYEVSAEVNDSSITLAKLSDDVVSSLELADTAIQLSDLDNYYTKSETSSNNQISDGLNTKSTVYVDEVKDDFLVSHISENDYNQKVKNDEILSNELYIVSSDYINAYGQQIKNLSAGTELSDAVNLEQLSAGLSSKQDAGNYVSATALDNYYTKSETSSSAEILDGLGTKSTVYVDGSKDDLSVIHVSRVDYALKLSASTVLSNEMYVVSSDYINAYDQQIKNLAPGNELSDAVNLEQLSTGLAAKQAAGNYVSATALDNYYTKSETSSASEIQISLSAKQNAGNYLSSHSQNTILSLDDDEIGLKTEDTAGVYYAVFSTNKILHNYSGSDPSNEFSLYYPSKSGMLALTSDIISSLSSYYTKSETSSSAEISDAVASMRFTTVISNACNSSLVSTQPPVLWDWSNNNHKQYFTNRFPDYVFQTGESTNTSNICLLGAGLPGSWNFNEHISGTYFVLNSSATNYQTKYGSFAFPVPVNAAGKLRISVEYCMSQYTKGTNRLPYFDILLDGAVVAEVRSQAVSASDCVHVTMFADVGKASGHTLCIKADNTHASCGVIVSCVKVDFDPADIVTAPPSTDESLSGVAADAYATGLALQSIVQQVHWAELTSMCSTSSLVPGKQYRIDDYACGQHQFDLIVVADTASTLNEAARAVQHAGDNYFASSNLAAWQAMYCLQNDTSRFAWADAQNGKGVIYQLTDEYGNSCPYDFKCIKLTVAGQSGSIYTFDDGNDGDASMSGSAHQNTVMPNIDVNGRHVLNNVAFACLNGSIWRCNTVRSGVQDKLISESNVGQTSFNTFQPASSQTVSI